MSRRWLFATLMSCASVQQAAAQATRISAPERNYLLEITQQWAAESPLGSLPLIPMGDSDVEVRVWGGYGLTGSSGVVLRRIAGRWRGWEIKVVPDTLSLATLTDTGLEAALAKAVASGVRELPPPASAGSG